jgi:hypothetical protein
MKELQINSVYDKMNTWRQNVMQMVPAVITEVLKYIPMERIQLPDQGKDEA